MCNKTFLWLRFNFHKLLVKTHLLPPIIITRVCLWVTKELDQCLLLCPQEPGWHLVWVGSSVAIVMYCLSISNKAIYRPSINRTPGLTNLHTKQNQSHYFYSEYCKCHYLRNKYLGRKRRRRYLQSICLSILCQRSVSCVTFSLNLPRSRSYSGYCCEVWEWICWAFCSSVFMVANNDFFKFKSFLIFCHQRKIRV